MTQGLCVYLESMSANNPNITAYLKTFCGWSGGVRAILRKYHLEFEEKDIIKNPALRWEMEQRSGQSLSPCVEIDSHMLADVSGGELETWLIDHGYVQPDNSAPETPIDSPCSQESHKITDLERLPSPGKIRY